MGETKHLAPYQFKPGNAGKQAGTVHAVTKYIKASITGCFEDIGGYEGFVEWARKNKTAFYTKIWPRLMPSVDSLPEEDKVEMLRAMLQVPRVQIDLYQGQNPPSQSTNEGEIVAQRSVYEAETVKSEPTPTNPQSKTA